VKDICSVKGRIGFRGYTTSDLVDEGEGAIAIGASHITADGLINLNSPTFISWAKYYESPEIMVNTGDVLIVQRGSTSGKIGIVPTNIGLATINPSIVLLKEWQISSHFGFYYLIGNCVRNYTDSLLSSTAIPMLSQRQIESIPICIPPFEDQLAIVENNSSVSKQHSRLISSIQNQIDKLFEYRQTLISAAVTGKIDLRERTINSLSGDQNATEF